MTHYTDRLPREIEVGARRTTEFANEVITTVGGHDVVNALWDAPLRRYECALPASRRDNAAYLEVIRLYELTAGGAHSFELVDWATEETVRVRFDSPLDLTGIDYRTDKIETFMLKEKRV